jgi:hypothetical protein
VHGAFLQRRIVMQLKMTSLLRHGKAHLALYA